MGTGGEVSVRCAHGDVVSYQLANVEIEVEGEPMHVEVGVAPNLPVPVLLGTDVPGLVELLQAGVRKLEAQEAMMVSTRAQKKRADAEAALQAARELQSMAQPKPVRGLGAREKEEDDQVNYEREPEAVGLQDSEGEKELTVESGLRGSMEKKKTVEGLGGSGAKQEAQRKERVGGEKLGNGVACVRARGLDVLNSKLGINYMY